LFGRIFGTGDDQPRFADGRIDLSQIASCQLGGIPLWEYSGDTVRCLTHQRFPFFAIRPFIFVWRCFFSVSLSLTCRLLSQVSIQDWQKFITKEKSYIDKCISDDVQDKGIGFVSLTMYGGGTKIFSSILSSYPLHCPQFHWPTVFLSRHLVMPLPASNTQAVPQARNRNGRCGTAKSPRPVRSGDVSLRALGVALSLASWDPRKLEQFIKAQRRTIKWKIGCQGTKNLTAARGQWTSGTKETDSSSSNVTAWWAIIVMLCLVLRFVFPDRTDAHLVSLLLIF
jgi:hypothetical protein